GSGWIQRSFWRSAARRRKVSSQRANLLVSRCARTVGPQKSKARALEHSECANQPIGGHSRVPTLELDGGGCLALHLCRKHSDCSALLCTRTRSRRAERFDRADLCTGSGIVVRKDKTTELPDALAGLRALYGSNSVGSRHGSENH